MMTEGERQKAIERIKKLIKLSEGQSNASGALGDVLANEAASAAALAAKLLTRYNLTMDEVEGAENASEMVDVASGVTVARLDPWRVALASAIGYYHMTKVFFRKVYAVSDRTGKPGMRYEFFYYGRKSNAEVAAYTLHQVYFRMLEMSEQVTSDYLERLTATYGVRNAYLVKGQGLAHPNIFRNSWLMGCVQGIGDKLKEIRTQYTSAESAIVLVRDQEVETAWTSYSSNMRTRSGQSSARYRDDAIEKGYKAGKNMEIQNGLEE